MPTKSKDTEEKSLQDYLNLEAQEDETPTGDEPTPDSGEQPEGGDDGDDIELEFGPDHPYYEEPAGDDDSDSDDDTGDEPDPTQQTQGDEPDEPADPRDNPDRHEYWQSQADKLQAQNEKLMKMLENQTGGGQSKKQEPQKNPGQVLKEKEAELNSLTVPDKPKRPENYSATDAYTDPDSPSFKYRAQLDDWNEEFTEVQLQKDKLKDEVYNMKLNQVAEPVNKMAKEKQMSSEQQKVVATLKKDHNFTDEQATDFIAEMSKPESMSLDNLARYYRHMKGVKSSDAQDSTNQKKKGNRSPKREAAPPIPLGSGAGGRVDDEDDEVSLGRNFGKGLLNFNR